MIKMIKLVINKKTGFKNLTSDIPVSILDNRGISFYSTANLNRIDSFNLPSGNYLIEQGNFKELKHPVSIQLMAMPLIEAYRKNPRHFIVLFDDNPHKCTVDWEEETITFDNSFKTCPLTHYYFILYHEYGHQYYDTEKYADMYSANEMIRKGFNPSQIGSSPLESLSSKQYERKANIINRL